MPITPEDVLRVVQELGPVVPNKIKQQLGQSDSTLINVYLSELKSAGKVRLTHLILGTSKFAYVAEQTPKLEALTQHLNEKDRRAATRLKEEGVIRAATQEPLLRVSLQNIPDFAKPIAVKTQEGEETFYRWFLLPSEQAQEKIKNMLGVKKPEEKVVSEVVTKEPEPEHKEKVKPPQKKQKKTTPEDQQTLTPPEPESAFGKKILTYFAQKDIHVKEFTEVRKDTEIDAIIELPTAVGRITYYCKARNKKNSNDGDVAAAILTAKSKMLPALYITTGTVTKKAKTNKELQEIQVVELGSRN